MEKPPGRLWISELLSPETIELNLTSQNKDGLLTELVQRVPRLEEIPEGASRLLKALQEREQLHSTGIGDGIALPHARNALVGLVDKPVIVFGRHNQGVPYGAIDGAPAKLFFLLVAPTVSSHLQILARISRLLRVPKLRQNLLTVETPAKTLEALKEAEQQLG